MKKEPLVSIIIATYNRGNLISRAINSIILQTYPNFEIIVVDGNSKDFTESVVKSFRDKRIVYFRQKKNLGMLSGKNKGLDLAKGEYICFLDDDDELLCDALDFAVKSFQKFPKANMFWLESIDSKTKSSTGFGIKEEGYIEYEDYLCEKIKGEFWPIFRKNSWGKARFDEKLWGAEGIILLRLFDKLNIYHIPKTVRIYYQDHGGNVCRFENQLKHARQYAQNNLAFLEEFGSDQKATCPKAYARRLAVLGFWQILSGKKAEGQKSLKNSLKVSASLNAAGLYFLSLMLGPKEIAWIYKKISSLKGR